MKKNPNKQILELSEEFLYPKSIIERFLKRYKKRAIKILKAIKTPSEIYTIRTNTLKISPKNLIEKLKKLGIKAKQHKTLPEAVLLPRKGPSRIPLLKKKVTIDKFASESVLCGSDLYVPGVKKFDKFKQGDKVTILSETQIPIAIGLATKDYKELGNIKKGIVLENVKSLYSIPNLKKSYFYDEGLFYNQSLPSILTSHILNPQKDEIIVDLCAGIGGKTTHIAQLMKNQGQIIAIDRSRNKIKKLNKNSNRMGIKNISSKIGDAKLLLPEFTNSADRVLIDPPCSALGVRPKLYETKTEQDIISSAKYQKYFIHIALKIVKPSGIIVYSTCTLSPEENELNIKYMVEKFGCKIIKPNIIIGSPGELTDKDIKYNFLQRFYPDLHKTSGFFIAKLEAPK
ncbi:MAG: RsmB/NOP family class I SAM-dependent RNA methyltransferase [Candidatus Helarchaeota archaeon]|nr:RsmB/NOP family class I SAM-dependent RNA methyltransferase [Candidatus Helarchaeota archaeon]